jgi:hypothetical protein
MPRRLPGWALFACVLLGGCQSLEMSPEEMTWQALHAFDVAQTMSAADDPCYVEDAWLTRRLIGREPSEAEVMLWGIGTAVSHWWIGNLLEDWDAPTWLQKVWSYGTITSTGYAIVNNHDEGIRAFSSNKPVAGCHR